MGSATIHTRIGGTSASPVCKPYSQGTLLVISQKPLMDGFRLPDRSSRIAGQSSELQSRLKRDHSWTAITTQADAQQAGGRRSCGGERSKSILRGRISWNAGLRSPSLPPR